MNQGRLNMDFFSKAILLLFLLLSFASHPTFEDITVNPTALQAYIDNRNISKPADPDLNHIIT